jgi:hypothetical protein
MQLPTPTIVITSPTIVATNKFELLYVNAPVLLVVGGVIAKGSSPFIFAETAKLDKTVVRRFTLNNAVILADV